MKNATFVCGGEFVPASRYRVHPIASGLSGLGWNTRTIHGYGPLDQKIGNSKVRSAYRLACRMRRAARMGLLATDGPLVVQRLALPWWSEPERLAARASSALVFDFDDAVFLGVNGRTHPLRSTALRRVFAASNHVVAGNEWLAGCVDEDVPVSVVPTCIDTSVYQPLLDSKHDPIPRIGWIGTSGNFPYLEQLVGPLKSLRERYDFRFEICSDVEDRSLLSRLGGNFTKWSADGELAFLQSLDIGLMPLFDDDWCRGKCSFKMIQYMAVGCPSVATAVGMNNDVLRGNVGGLLVDKRDWISPLESLLESADERARLGREARKSALERYDTQVAIKAYERILHGLQ